MKSTTSPFYTGACIGGRRRDAQDAASIGRFGASSDDTHAINSFPVVFVGNICAAALLIVAALLMIKKLVASHKSNIQASNESTVEFDDFGASRSNLNIERYIQEA